MSNAPNKKGRTKKIVVEEDPCTVCCEKYTPILRKKIVCKYCNAHTCSKCIERYLLEGIQDAHCLHCKVNYSDDVLHEICTRTYLSQTYFKHRQQILISREKAHLPGLQVSAVNEQKNRENKVKIAILREQMLALNREYTQMYNTFTNMSTAYVLTKNTGDKEETEKKKRELDAYYNILSENRTKYFDLRNKIHDIRFPITLTTTGEEVEPEEKKKFIRRCTREGCQGFLSTAWKCGICEHYSCSKCFVVKGQKHDDPHECKQEDIDTAELIKKDSKPCPKCGEFIMKSSGCFARDTPILMWDGSSKMSQDIRIGDELIGDDGMKRVVLDLTSGVDTLYEVRQTNGMTYVVNSKHTLVLKYTGKGIVHSYIVNKLLRYKTEDFKYHILVDEYIQLENVVKKALVGYKYGGGESDIQVKEVGLGEYFGWKVDSNSRFLLNDTTITKNCDQMFCISCQTPWSWNTGKIITNGIIHNPHYFEWLRRNGEGVQRNPADVPCGGYPNGWELRRMPKGIRRDISDKFYEFHRICMELQDISERAFRSHIDNATTDAINIRFLLNDFDEKHWGQLLAKNEKKRKRDAEVQEILGAFRMVAVELINRIQNHGDQRFFNAMSVEDAEKMINDIDVEIQELIQMINGALQKVSISYRYTVPQFIKKPYTHYGSGVQSFYYNIINKNFSNEVKSLKEEKGEQKGEQVACGGAGAPEPIYRRNSISTINSEDSDTEGSQYMDSDNDPQIIQAIQESLKVDGKANDKE